MEEIWKRVIVNRIPTETFYVSNFGRVLNKKTGNFLYGYTANNGYQMAHLRMEVQKLCSIHRLVMIAFDPVENMETLQINHKDGNKTNNHIDNLEWATALENIRHSYSTGLQPNESKKLYQYDLNGNFIKEWINTYTAAKELNFTPSTLLNSAKCGKSKAYNFMWRFFYKEKITPYENYQNKPVYMYDNMKTKLIKVFSSNKETARFIKCAESTMSRYLTGIRKQPSNSPYFFTYEQINV